MFKPYFDSRSAANRVGINVCFCLTLIFMLLLVNYYSNYAAMLLVSNLYVG